MKIQLQQILLLLLFIGITHSTLSAQTKKGKKDADKYVHIDMKDGTVVEGTLIGRLGDTVVIESKTLGLVSLNIKNIKHIEDTKKEYLKGGEYIPIDNIHAPHGLFAPTGFNLRKGEGYYKNIYLLINQINYGFTDYFSVEAGTELVSFFATGKPFQVAYVAPKFSVPVAPDVHIGVGVYVSKFNVSLFNGPSPLVTIPFGVATVGNRDQNFSIGFGSFLFSNNTGKLSVFSASGQLHLSKKFSLMTENYIFRSGLNSPIGVLSIGIRYANEDYTFDAGLIAIGLPYLGFSFPFGHPK